MIPSVPDVEAAFAVLENELADAATAPRSDRELVARVGQALLIAPPVAARVYVPDSEAPTTPEVRDEQINGPLQYLEPELRALSSRAKAIVDGTSSLASEAATVRAGLASQINALSARVAAAATLAGSSRLAWMRLSDRFLDLSGVDPTISHDVLVEAASGAGVTLAPTGEQDLTGVIQSFRVVPGKSGRGLPGNNAEIASLQGDPSTATPAAGSGSALAKARQDSAADGGTGAEPTAATVTYVGGADLHADMTAQLSDVAEAYYDTEVLYVPPSQKCLKRGTAYVYDRRGQAVSVPGVTHNYGWRAKVTQADGTQTTSPIAYLADPPTAGHDASSLLRLSEEMDFGGPVPVNQMQITVRSQGGLWPDIDSVLVSLDHNRWFPMSVQGGATSWQGNAAAAAWGASRVDSGGNAVSATGDGSRGTSTWEIPSWVQSRAETGTPTFRYVVVNFSQPDAYECPKGVGHPYYVEVSKQTDDSKSLFGLSHSHKQSTSTVRLPTADRIVTVTAGQSTSSKSQDGKLAGSLLGAAANLLPKTAIGGTLSTVSKLTGGLGNLVSGIVTGLFGSRSHTTQVLQAGEYLDVFQGFRQCISVGRLRPLARTFSTDTPGQMVTRAHAFDHPFTALRLLVDQSVPSGTAIAYDVSTDDGQTWQTVAPFDLGQPPAPYLSSASVGTVSFDTPQTSVRLRATLSTTLSHTAPRWLGYALEALPI